MKQKPAAALLFMALLFLVPSCASVGVATFSYQEPTPLTVENEAFLMKPIVRLHSIQLKINLLKEITDEERFGYYNNHSCYRFPVY